MRLIVFSCIFRRTEGSDWEKGIAIGKDIGDVESIIDKKGKYVGEEIWDYKSFGNYPQLVWFEVK